MKQVQKLQAVNKTYLALGFFAFLVLLFYGNTLQNGFALEDSVAVENNEYIRSLAYLPKVVTGCLMEFVDGSCKGSLYPYYRPVPSLSILLSYQISSAAWIFHLANLLYFFAAAALVFLLAKLLTKSYWASFASSTIFIAHPINSGVVNSIAAGPELTSAVFILLSAILYFRYRVSGSSKNLILVYVSFFLALLSKEPSVLLVGVFLVMDVLFFKVRPKKLITRPHSTRYALFAVPFAVYYLMKVAVVGGALGGSLFRFTIEEGVHARFVLFFEYVRRLVYPFPLSIYHPFEKSSNFLDFQFVLGLASVILFLAGLVFFFRKKNAVAAFSLVWFALFLSLALLFLVGEADHMVSERFLFIPSIGFSFLAGWLLFHLFHAKKIQQAHRYIVLVLLAVLLLGSWFTVFQRNQDWKNDTALYESTIQTNPNAHEIRRLLGEIYIKEGRIEKARAAFEEIIARDPNWRDITMAYKGLGDYYRAVGDNDAALEYYEQSAAIGNSPRDYLPHYRVGLLYMEREQYLKGFSSFCYSLGLFNGDQSVQANLDLAAAAIDTEYIQTGTLYKEIISQLDKSPIQKLVLRDSRCEEDTCEYAISFTSSAALEALPPFLITASTPSGTNIEILNTSFNPDTGIIILAVDSQYENQELTFVFPSCGGTYYEVPTS